MCGGGGGYGKNVPPRHLAPSGQAKHAVPCHSTGSRSPPRATASHSIRFIAKPRLEALRTSRSHQPSAHALVTLSHLQGLPRGRGRRACMLYAARCAQCSAARMPRAPASAPACKSLPYTCGTVAHPIQVVAYVPRTNAAPPCSSAHRQQGTEAVGWVSRCGTCTRGGCPRCRYRSDRAACSRGMQRIPSHSCLAGRTIRARHLHPHRSAGYAQG